MLRKRTLARLRNRMASGLVVLVPVVVTVLVLRLLLSVMAGILLPVIDPTVASWPPIWREALSLAALVVVVYVLGEVATHVVGRRVLGVGDAILLRVPLVKVVYSASKQVVAAFRRPAARAFKSVVLIEFPRQGMRSVAFVTGKLTGSGGETWYTVFVPTTPNPTSGFLQIVRESEIIRTDYTVEEAVKMIMSLGVLVPDRVSSVPTPAPEGRVPTP